MITLAQNTAWLLELLDSCGVSKKEFVHRKTALENEHMRPGSIISKVSDQYFNRAHEIKSFYFLQQFGNVDISEDCNHRPGCDCRLKGNYQIECVCSSVGENAEETGLAQLCTSQNMHGQIVDYGKKKQLLYARLTSSIKEKLDFYNRHIKTGTVSSQSPYLVFLGLGALSYELFAGDYGIEFTSILFGKGDLTLSIDMNTGRMTGKGYTHNNELVKHNNAKINCNIFCTKEYNCVSGIIISDADLGEEYTVNNTWLFLNPNANIKINPNDFPHIVYWDIYSESEYGPYKNGKRLANL